MCYIIPKTKKFGCVGMGDLTFLFKSCEIYESQGDLSTVVSHIYTYDRAQNILNFVQPLQNLIL